MKITGTRCDDCPKLGIVDDLFKFYDNDNNLVSRVHQRILDTPDGFQARIIAQDISWLEFEKAELSKTGDNDIGRVFYEGHSGLLRLNSEYFSSVDQAQTQLEEYRQRSLTWLSQQMNALIEVV